MLCVSTFSLFAAGPWNWELFGAGLALVGLILFGAILIAWASRWRRRPGDGALGPEQELTHYRSLYDSGQLTKEEFDRIRLRLERRSPPSKPSQP